MHMILDDYLITAIGAFSLELKHVAFVPPLIVKFCESILTGVKHISGVHDVLVVIVNLNACWPILHLNVNACQARFPLNVVVLDFKGIVVHDILHHHNWKLVLLKDSYNVAGYHRDEIDDRAGDIDKHIAVAAEWNYIVQRTNIGVASSVDEHILETGGAFSRKVDGITLIGDV